MATLAHFPDFNAFTPLGLLGAPFPHVIDIPLVHMQHDSDRFFGKMKIILLISQSEDHN